MDDTKLMQRILTSLRQTWRQRTVGTFASTRNIENYVPEAHLLFRRARAMGRSGSLDMAARLYSDAAALEPTLAEAIESEGEVLDVKGQRALAVQRYQTSRKVRADTRLGPPDRHFVLRQRGQFIAEIIAYDSVVASLRKKALPYIARGNAYLAAAKPQNALADYLSALKVKPNSPDIMILKGESLSMLGRHSEALEAFDAALAVKPDDAEALGGRAIVRVALGQLDAANADWRQQWELLPHRASARACVAMRLADYDLALRAFGEALQKEPLDPYWHLYRLSAQRRIGLTTSNDIASLVLGETWPAQLLGLHAGRVSEREVLKQADTASRQAEALFQLGVLAIGQDRKLAERHWREVVQRAEPSMIEYAAARNELSRLD